MKFIIVLLASLLVSLVLCNPGLESDLRALENDVLKIESEERNDLASNGQQDEEATYDDDASLTPSEQLSAPLLPTTGKEGAENGPCRQGMRGRCQASSKVTLGSIL
jgi:hypothetical protein